MSQITLASRVAKNSSQVIDRVVDGETLVIHLTSGDYFSLNRVGTRVWEQLDGSAPIADVVDTIVSEYDVSPTQATSEVLELVDELVQEKLAVLVSTSDW